jgi:hypothetical protein
MDAPSNSPVGTLLHEWTTIVVFLFTVFAFLGVSVAFVALVSNN